ncbi:hypothetical protein KY285_025462 [Solanum tuberosum]|nr:hypothetical protein KY289_023924 [Solanum tuberosum]KAH0677661.1 hypothetical protein KY285_025462 [Solanum tuberosum]
MRETIQRISNLGESENLRAVAMKIDSVTRKPTNALDVSCSTNVVKFVQEHWKFVTSVKFELEVQLASHNLSVHCMGVWAFSSTNGFEHVIASTSLYVVGPDDDMEDIKEATMEDMKSVMSMIDKSGEGVCVQATTLGSLEALLEFLKTPGVSVLVSGIGIGPAHKNDVIKASVMLEKKKEYATILAFDVKVTQGARELSDELRVKVFMADIIYHLFDQFKSYIDTIKEEKKKEVAEEAVFPCVLKIVPNCVFNKKDPIVLGVDVLEGIFRLLSRRCHGYKIRCASSCTRCYERVEELAKHQKGNNHVKGQSNVRELTKSGKTTLASGLELTLHQNILLKIEELELKKKQQETQAIETSRKAIPSMEKCKKQLMIANSDFMEKMEDKFLNLVSKLEEKDKAITSFLLSAE